jgi:hypothetical protein
MALYVLLATIAALVPDREAVTESFEEFSGVNPKPIAGIAAIAMIFRLAQLTSLVTLAVFALVNLALFTLGRARPGTVLARWRFLGLLGACLAVALGGWQVTHGLFS